MSEVRRGMRRALNAPSELVRWYSSPVGLVFLLLVGAAGVGSLAGYPGVGVVALAVLLAVGVPYKFIRERADTARMKHENAVEIANVRSEIALTPTFDDVEATMKGLRKEARKSIRTLRGRLTAVHTSHVRYAENTNIELDDLRINSEDAHIAIGSRIDELANVNSAIDALTDVVGELRSSQEQLLAQLEEQRHTIISDGSPNHFFLAAGYRRRSELAANFDDTANEDGFQREVYDYALGVATQVGAKRICDFGCGSAFKLMKRFSNFETVGIDMPRTVEFLRATYPDRTWHESGELTPELFDDFDVVIASDVIEHLKDPSLFLDALARSNAKDIVLSTPARELLVNRGDRYLGPPGNTHHYLEWTTGEFAMLVGSYLDIVAQHISNEPQATQLVHARVR